jgi:hypothetical protein
LRTIHGTVHPTFQRAAQAAGLFEEQEEGLLAMEDAIANYKSPSELRFLFCLLILEGATALPLWDKFRDDLCRDFTGHSIDNVPPYAHQCCLQKINDILLEHGKTVTDYGLPHISSFNNEIREELQYFALRASSLFNFVQQSYNMMSADQHIIWDTLLHAVDNLSSRSTLPNLFFVTGKAGRGKSFIIHCLIAHLRSRSQIAAIAGTTALSISNIDHARTAHSLFGLPIIDDDSAIHIESRISPRSSRAEYLRHATAIVWDELPMAHVALIEAVDSLLRQIMRVNIPFGGKILIGIGDFRQVAPVVKGGGASETFMASILSSTVWPQFRILELTVPIRNAEDPDFAEFIDYIGEDCSGNRVILDHHLSRSSDINIIHETLFTPNVLLDPPRAVKRTFLTPLNFDVDSINSVVLNNLPSDLCK